jgi:hypothetical protein
MGLPVTSTEFTQKDTSSVEPLVDILIIPGRVDVLLFGEFVEGETELLFSEFDFALGRSGLEPGVSAEEQA